MKLKIKLTQYFDTIALFINHDVFFTEIAAADLQTINNSFIENQIINNASYKDDLISDYSQKIIFIFKLLIRERRLSFYKRIDTPFCIQGDNDFETMNGREFEIAEINDVPSSDNIYLTENITWDIPKESPIDNINNFIKEASNEI